MNTDTLIYFGGEAKMTGGSTFGGHLVLFGSSNQPDASAERDFFTAQTDFDLEDGERKSGYYQHGFDVKIGNRKIGTGTLKKDDVGLWLEGQLAARDEYIDAITEMVKQGALGLSSGALSHLVRRERAAKNTHRITHWPIGEWSLTPTPAEPRTMAVPLKSLYPDLPKTEAVTIETERDFEEFLREAGYSKKDATAITLHGFKARRRDADEEANNADREATRLSLRRELLRTQLLRSIPPNEQGSHCAANQG